MRINQLKEGLVHTRTAAYLPYNDNLQRMAKLGYSAKEVTEQTRYKPESGDSATHYYPIAVRYSDGLLGINTRDGSVAELLDEEKALENAEPKEEDILKNDGPKDKAL